ncbi:glycosyltransferase family 2 protein [Roseovarius aestuariivivens]|uniref:glycosyltransferase family 2 protein n=1 Tax=Roseovarius aestuariivivens TaxID=1888910 RepID=UPI00107FEE95|nr:glycosyltransferase [Roseovarius aestuariivivens]
MTGDTPTLSVCIPAYDMGGQGGDFLAASLNRIASQTLQGIEVVVSDQSDTDAVAQVCDSFQDRLTLRRVDYRNGPRQASANTNNALRHAQGRVLKILFQDDLLARDDALALTEAAFDDPGTRWCLCGSATTPDGQRADNPMVPRLTPAMRFGRNTVSSPSVLAMRADDLRLFDENLIWLMDVEMYHRLNTELGPPAILPETLVLNRLHPGQVSAGVRPDLRRRELAYIRGKTRAGESWADWWEYHRQRLKAR